MIFQCLVRRDCRNHIFIKSQSSEKCPIIIFTFRVVVSQCGDYNVFGFVIIVIISDPRVFGDKGVGAIDKDLRIVSQEQDDCRWW